VSEVGKHMAVPPERVWAQLADGWIYTGWVVGATHIRGVDPHWPQVGAQLRHQVGAWPFVVSDSTAVLESRPPDRLVLQARAWPAGEARVVLTITADGAGSMVRMNEWPTNGPGRWLHNPVQAAVLRRRNMESLARLASIAENRSIPDAAAGPGDQPR
jgi:hypothetical protein